MAKTKPTADQLEVRLADVSVRLTEAEAAQEVEEAAAAAASLAGPVDELALARNAARLGKARARVELLRDERDRLVALGQVAMEEAAAIREAERWARADDYMGEFEADVGRVDAATEALAAAIVKANAAKVRAFQALPEPPDHAAFPMFARSTLQLVIELRLYGLTDREWLPRQPGLETAATARRLPTAKQRVAAERQLLLARHRPRSEPGPEAA